MLRGNTIRNLDGVVQGRKAVTRVLFARVLGAIIAQIIVGAVEAFVADAMDFLHRLSIPFYRAEMNPTYLVTAVANCVVVLVAARVTQGAGILTDGSWLNWLKQVARVVTVSIVLQAVLAKVIVLAHGARDKERLFEDYAG